MLPTNCGECSSSVPHVMRVTCLPSHRARQMSPFERSCAVSTVETVYTIHSPSRDMRGSLTSANRRMSAIVSARAEPCALPPEIAMPHADAAIAVRIAKRWIIKW